MDFFSNNPYERGIVNPLCDGEQQVVDYLESLGYKVASVAEDREYQLMDVDILAYKDSLEDEVKIEVKNDGVISRTGNFFLETCCDIEKSKKGWFTYTGADYIYYRDRVNEKVYILSMDKLRGYVEAHNEELEIGYANDYRRDGTIAKTSSGYKVPLDSFLRDYPETEIVDI